MWNYAALNGVPLQQMWIGAALQLWALGRRVCFDFTASALEATETWADLASGHSRLSLYLTGWAHPLYTSRTHKHILAEPVWVSHTRCKMLFFSEEAFSFYTYLNEWILGAHLKCSRINVERWLTSGLVRPQKFSPHSSNNCQVEWSHLGLHNLSKMLARLVI